MTVFVLRRLLQSLIVIFVMSLIVFFGVNVIGNPVDVFIDPACDLACQRQAMRELGLDRPIHEQYIVFLRNALTGHLGNSFVLGTPALPIVIERMPATFELAILALIITIVFGIPLGMWAGLKPDSISGKLIMGGSILGFSLPAFWVGMMFILVFSLEFGWLPTTGRGQTVEVWGIQFSFLTADGLSHMILPAVNLALLNTALVIRLARAGMREVLLSDYVKFAHAKGLSELRVIFVHVLKNILIPIVTVLGLELANIIAFAVVTETIFAWPGMGKLLIDSIRVLDRPVVVAFLVIVVFMFIVINLVVDIIYALLDPRVRLYEVRA